MDSPRASPAVSTLPSLPCPPSLLLPSLSSHCRLLSACPPRRCLVAVLCRQCIEWVNLLCLTPFAFIAVLGFLRGWNWLRLPAIIVSSFTFYSLILCIGTTL